MFLAGGALTDITDAEIAEIAAAVVLILAMTRGVRSRRRASFGPVSVLAVVLVVLLAFQLLSSSSNSSGTSLTYSDATKILGGVPSLDECRLIAIADAQLDKIEACLVIFPDLPSRFTAYQKGVLGEKTAIAEYLLAHPDRQLVGEQIQFFVSVRGVTVRTIVDAVFRDKDNNGSIRYYGLEAKNGPYARYTGNQKVAYPCLQLVGGVAAGARADLGHVTFLVVDTYAYTESATTPIPPASAGQC
jgi:hypothetical protein